MASAVQSMRLCLRAASRRAATQAATAPRQCLRIRSFSSTPFPCRPAAKKDDVDDLEDALDGIEKADGEADGEIDPALLERLSRNPDFDKARRSFESAVNEMGSMVTEGMRPPPPPIQQRQFWGEDEPDSDMLMEETSDTEFDEDDIMSMAHAKFEEFREYREYARIAAWQMPLLSSKPFWPRDEAQLALLTNVCRVGHAFRSTDGSRTFAIPLHHLHGRVPSRREESSRRILTQRPASG